ncbi:UbiA family prenyltransferase [Symmachiella dynata]|uniref:UbiA family prenyltransferase n=1 Tax=Symmachiella dynata TaxID=2527995 RepID=UPI0030ED660D
MNRSKLLAYLQIVRLPALFTAMADIFLGYLIVHRSFTSVLDFALLLMASGGLYLSGMVFNDVFDRRIDAQERPGRPIPSGRVPLTNAIGLGGLLMAGGVGAASVVGPSSLTVALMIVAAIFAYDWLLKATPLGPIAMGSCRSLNVILGASTAPSLWRGHHIGIALALGVYIVGVTWFARSEANAGRRSKFQAVTGMLLVNTGVMLLISFVLSTKNLGNPLSVLMLFAVILLVINRRLTAAIFDPVGPKIGLAIKTMLLSLPLIDAALVLFVTQRVEYSLAVAALLIPALLLARRIAVT